MNIHPTDLQKALQQAMLTAPPQLRKAIYEEVEAEVKVQRKYMEEAKHIGSAMLNGGAPEKLVTMQMEALRHCAQSIMKPEEFHQHWCRMLVCGVMLYEDMLTVKQAVADAQATDTK